MDGQTVLVLLATYNGEKYIRQQMDSLLNQSYRAVHILVSDDGSADKTKQILEEYAQAEPDRVTHYCSGQRFGSAQRHFLHLLRCFHDAPYIMLCDQDDVWHERKIEKTLEKMQSIERAGKGPVLVHTDLRVVDEQGREIAPSFCAHSAIDGTRVQPNQLLVQNVVTGCTVMLNHDLASLACQNGSAEGVLMHDWWLALLAACCGTVGFLPEPTIDYRQHGQNTVGAKNVRKFSYLKDRLLSGKMRDSLIAATGQAEIFLERYQDQLSQEQKEMFSAFASTKDMDAWGRNRVYWKYKLWKKGLHRICAQFLGL